MICMQNECLWLIHVLATEKTKLSGTWFSYSQWWSVNNLSSKLANDLNCTELLTVSGRYAYTAHFTPTTTNTLRAWGIGMRWSHNFCGPVLSTNQLKKIIPHKKVLNWESWLLLSEDFNFSTPPGLVLGILTQVPYFSKSYLTSVRTGFCVYG